MTRRAAFVLVALAIAALAGCGSDDTVVDLGGPDATADAADERDATLDANGTDDEAGDDARTSEDGALTDVADAGPPDDADGDADLDAGAVPDSADAADAADPEDAAKDAGKDAASEDASTCPEGQTACDGGCTELGFDPDNCGACGKVCKAFAHEEAVCAAKACAEVCATGYADCDLKATDGCESHLTADPKNCGRCGHVCPQNDVCAAGKCTHK